MEDAFPILEVRRIRFPIALRELSRCDACIQRLRNALLELPGVYSVEVDIGSSTLSLRYDPSLVSLERVEHRAEELGIEVKEKIAHRVLTLTGLDCPDCALKVESSLQSLPGVLSAQVNFTTAKLMVEFHPEKVAVPEIIRRIEALGYGVAGEDQVKELPFLARNRLILPTVLSGGFLLIGYLSSSLPLGIPSEVFYGLAILAGGGPTARSAMMALLSRTLDINFLMLVAALGAVALGEWFEGAMVIFLFAVGNTLESVTAEKARRAISALAELLPRRAVVLREGQEVEVFIEEVQPGEVILVKPGERIPLDGEILEGTSWVDQSALTGESIPVEKLPGDSVLAGSLNGYGALKVRVTRSASVSSIARIVELVEQAQAQKAPVQRFTEAFGRVYTPIVVITASGLALLAFLPGVDQNAILGKALTLLVVACPCALVLSSPVAVASALVSTARMGVLVKGGVFLEGLARLKVLALDKTGTLTLGRPKLMEYRPTEGVDPQELLSWVASVEAKSEHPLAQALLHYVRLQRLPVARADHFQVVPGRGVEAQVDGVRVRVGNQLFLEEGGISVEEASLTSLAEKWAKEGMTVVWVARDHQCAGILAFGDTMRKEAQQAIRQLRKLGIERFFLLTGDEERTATPVAQELGVDEVYARLLPEQKAEVLQRLLDQYRYVGFVGDGINDAPALALATVGIAMGAAGTEIAIETADVALMGSDLRKLAEAIQLARQTRQIILQNIIFSVAVVIGLVVTTLLFGLRLSLGIAGHEGSALLVILNGMRLLRTKDHANQ